MPIDQLFKDPIVPEVPAPTGIDNLDEEVVEQEVTWRDFPAPGTIFQRDLTDRETTAVKNFGQGLVNFQEQLSLDLIPGLGEQRMAGYGTEEVQLMIEAAKRKDVPGTIAHGVGVPIMAAGTFPWWFGVPGKWLARGYRAATAPFRKKAKYFDQAANTMIGTGHVAMVNRALNTPQKRVAYEQWLKGLPEYRSVADQTMVRRNIEEFLQLPPERIQLLDIEGRAEAATAARLPPAGGPDTIEGIVAENKRLVKEQTTHHQVGVKDKTEMLQSGSVPTRITEKFSLGESLAPVRTGAQATTSEFLGSHAYDVIGMANFNQMPVKNMMEYLAGMVRSGKLKKEELFDAGLLKLDAANKPVGGTLFDLSANTPNMVIGKQDVLKILKESPAENLKIQTYRSATVDPAVYYDLYASTSMMGNTMDNFLQKTIFSTKNTGSRSKLRQVQKDVAALDKSMFDTANHLSFENSNFRNEFFFPMMERMDALMPSLDSGTQQVLRAYMENAKKINRMSNDIQVTKTGPVQAFKSSGGAHSGHESSTMEGGFGYSEKVIYLDETIPFNRDKGRTRFTSHFPQDNPIVHSRYKTRYDRSGNQITAIEEIQSDTLQPFWDTGAKTKRETMLSPFGNQLTEAYVRRRLVELNKQMEPFLPKNLKKEVAPGQWVKRSMTDKELKNLQKIDAEKAELRNFLTKRDFQIEGQATQAVQPGVRGTTEKVDFFPYMRRTGGVPGYDVLMIKAMLDDAIRTGKKGITIVPAGVGDRSTDAGMYLFYGDAKGTKLKGLEKKAITKKGKKKISPDAIYIDALKVVAKQIEKEHGIKLKVVQREIYNYNPMNMFGIENKSGNIIASFKTRQNRDFILNQKNQASPSKEGFKGVNFSKDAPGLPADVHRIPSGSFKALVLEIPDSAAKILSKKKLSTYRHGGLVAITPKREYFAPVI